MPHRNAPLTEPERLRLARRVVEDGSPLRRAAERFQVPCTTAARWAARRRAGRPGCPADQARITGLRVRQRLGPDRLAAGPAPLDRAPGPGLVQLCPAGPPGPRRCVRPRRYERHRPGQLVHVDVKKLASFADLKRILGLDTLTTRSILATAYQVAGRLDDA
jgi:hypothetical protein